jgi:hypothetical protein
MATDRRVLIQQRGEILQSLIDVQGFRPGKVVVHRRKCGKAGCHCAQAGDAGHEPQFFWVYSVDGKPKTVTLTSPTQVKQYQEQTERYVRFQQLTKRLVEVETALSDQEEEPTPLSASEWGALKKKLLQRSKRVPSRRGR